MQSLSDAIIPAAPADACARQLLETVPLVMQFIRRQMRALRVHDLSVPQLRTLYYISVHNQPTLSDAAEFIGLSLPAMSRLVEGLVRKSLATRTSCPDDRRCVRLALTARGRAALDASWKGTHARLVDEVATLTPEERGVISASMSVLRETFDPDAARTT